MGIHAVDNLSHLAHDPKEPFVEGHYDYDEFVIAHKLGADGAARVLESFHGHRGRWDQARLRFLKLFNEEKQPVILWGRVFN